MGIQKNGYVFKKYGKQLFNKRVSNRLPKKVRFFRSYNQTKFFENYVIFVIIPTGACQPVALWPLR